MKNYKWIVSTNNKDKKFPSLAEAIKYAREEVIGEKNPRMNLNTSFQTNENFEVDFYDICNSKVDFYDICNSKKYYIDSCAQIIREDRYYYGREMAIEAGNDPKTIIKNMA